MFKKQSQIKIKPLTAKFFNDLANKIYNSKTKKFLRLCEGTLTNGPDPTDKKRKMRCGLGEMYFQMTGEHTGYLEEEDVIRLAMYNLSPISPAVLQFQKIKTIIYNSDSKVKSCFQYSIEEVEDYSLSDLFSPKESSIYSLLKNVPHVNDAICSKNDENYVMRSKDVAEKFRKIAKILSSIKPIKK